MERLTIPQICELEHASNPYFKEILSYRIIAETNEEVLVEYRFVEQNLVRILSNRTLRIDKTKLIGGVIVR